MLQRIDHIPFGSVVLVQRHYDLRDDAPVAIGTTAQHRIAYPRIVIVATVAPDGSIVPQQRLEQYGIISSLSLLQHSLPAVVDNYGNHLSGHTAHQRVAARSKFSRGTIIAHRPRCRNRTRSQCRSSKQSRHNTYSVSHNKSFCLGCDARYPACRRTTHSPRHNKHRASIVFFAAKIGFLQISDTLRASLSR